MEVASFKVVSVYDDGVYLRLYDKKVLVGACIRRAKN